MLDEDGNEVATAITDSTGNYTFEDVEPGDYSIVEEDPDGFGPVGDTDGENDNTIGEETPVTVVAGEDSPGNDFVDEELGTIAGTVTSDSDGDGFGDDPLPGVIVELFADENLDGIADDPANPIATAVTDSNGDFIFEDVTPGDYVIVEDQPTGFDSVSDGDATDPADDAPVNDPNDDVIPVSVDPGETDDGNNFVEETPGSISGSVLADTTGDGQGDTGIPGVILTLKTADGQSIDSDPDTAGVQETTAITDALGNYTFPGVEPGEYIICQEQPENFLDIEDGDTSDDGDTTPNTDTLDNEIPVTVTPGESDSGNNFVELQDKADSFSEFQDEFADVLGTENQPGDNPDGDIFNNALEYALYLHPGEGVVGSSGGFCLTKSQDGIVTAEFLRRRGGLSDVTYILEGADSLGTPTVWGEITSVTPVVDDTSADLDPTIERVSFNNLQAASEFSDGTTTGVVRLVVVIDGVSYPTKAFGWQCIDYNDFQCSTFSDPFSEKPVFSGTFGTAPVTLATDGAGNVTLDVSDSASGADLAPAVGTDGEFYIQITSGPLEGERFDILSGGTDELTLVNDPEIFSESDGVESLNTLSGIPADADFAGASYQVIRYRTVGEAFPLDSTYAGLGRDSSSTGTRLLFFNNRLDNPGFEILFIFDGGTPGDDSDDSWILEDDLVLLQDQSDYRLDPVGGNWIHPRESGDFNNPSTTPPVTQVSFGMIACHDQAVALNEGFNMVGAVWPFDQSPAGANGREYTTLEGFVGGTTPNQSAEVLFWAGDDAADLGLPYQETYNNYMLLDGGGFNFWLDPNDASFTNANEIDLFESHRSAILELQSGNAMESHLYPLPDFGLED